MNAIDLSRRNFLVGATAATGGLTLGFTIPFADEASAQGLPPEVNAWVVVKPDDTVVIFNTSTGLKYLECYGG